MSSIITNLYIVAYQYATFFRYHQKFSQSFFLKTETTSTQTINVLGF